MIQVSMANGPCIIGQRNQSRKKRLPDSLFPVLESHFYTFIHICHYKPYPVKLQPPSVKKDNLSQGLHHKVRCNDFFIIL